MLTVLEAMVPHSDNTTTDMALKRVGADRVRPFIASIGPSRAHPQADASARSMPLEWTDSGSITEVEQLFGKTAHQIFTWIRDELGR